MCQRYQFCLYLRFRCWISELFRHCGIYFVFHFIRMFFVMHTHLYTSKYSLNSKKADQCLQTYVHTSVYFNISHLITSLNYICIQTQKDIKFNIYLIILHLLIMLHSQWRKYLNYRQML